MSQGDSDSFLTCCVMFAFKKASVFLQTYGSLSHLTITYSKPRALRGSAKIDNMNA